MRNTSQHFPLIDIYQSKFFGEKIPKEVGDFNRVHFTEAVDDDLIKSVNAMRQQMFDENETNCAVFIGGMKGILDEYHMLKERYPKAEYLAFASTGGASVDVYKEEGISNHLLESGYAYTSIFRELLKPYRQH